MIDLYTFGTPNGRKASVMLEEVGLPYKVHVIDIKKGMQMAPEFIAINPNNKIPAIVDWEGPGGGPYTVFESGAILMYLAEKTGSDLLPTDMRARFDTIQWLMFQMGGLGPMLGQTHHFRQFAPEKIPYAIERYEAETARLYGVMDARLGKVEYLAGNFYSIADIACYPWAARHEWQGVDLATYPHLKRWYEAISERPAVKKGMSVPE
ncbi:MAG: glutathione binding-like protein [Rhodospirillales bacterium]|nr:glutathione binding-like protein [Rhodospirillales bacterium]